MLIFTLRLLTASAGLLLIYSSVFLYENEEKKIQNKLEEWWLHLSYGFPATVSKHLAFLQNSFRITSQLMDSLYGRNVKSWKFFSTSILLSYGFYLLSESIFSGGEVEFTIGKVAAVCILCAPIFLAIKFSKFSKVRNFMALSVMLLLYAGLFMDSRLSSVVNGVIGFSCLIAVGVLSDMLVIRGIKNSLIKGSETAKARVLIGMFLVLVVFSTLSLTIPYFLSYFLEGVFSFLSPFTQGSIGGGLSGTIRPRLNGPIGIEVVYQIPDWQKLHSVAINLITIVPFFVLVAVIAAYLLHHLFSPLLLRLLYNVQRAGILKNKKSVFVVGIALVGFGINPDLFSMKSLLEAFGLKLP